MRTKNALLLTILFSSVLAGCAMPTPTVPIEEEESQVLATPVKTTLVVATTTNLPVTPTHAPTALPTATPITTFTPSPTPGTFSVSRDRIEATSIGRIKKLDSLGKGFPWKLGTTDDGQTIVIRTETGIYLYDAQSLGQIGFLEGFQDFHLVPGKSAFVAVTPQQNFALVNLPDGRVIQEMTPMEATGIGLLAISQNGKYLGAVIEQAHETRADWMQYRIDVWDLEQNKLLSTLLSDLIGLCTAMAISEDGTQLIGDCYASGPSMFKKLVLWNIPEQDLKWVLSNEGKFTQYPFSKDGSLVATYTSEYYDSNYVIIRRSSDGAEVGRVPGKVSDNPFSDDGKQIVTSSFQQIRIWYVTSGESVKRIETGLDWPSVSFHENGELILVNEGEQTWRTDDYSQDTTYQKPVPPAEPMTGSLFRELDHLIGLTGIEVLGGQELFMWGYNAYEGVVWWKDSGHGDIVEAAVDGAIGQPALIPMKDQIAICTEDGLKIISVVDSAIQTLIPCRSYTPFLALAFSPDGSMLYMNSGSLIDVVDLESGELIGQLRGHSLNVGSLRISDDGKQLISSSRDSTGNGYEVILWGLDPNTMIRRWVVPSIGNLMDAQWTAGNEVLITSFDTISIWRVEDGWYLKNIEGSAFDLSPDGELAAVVMKDGQIEFYDTENWLSVGILDTAGESNPASILTYFSPHTQIESVRFLDEGRILMSQSSGNVIEFWGVP